MRFLIDQCISPLVATGLRDRGYDARHAEELGQQSAVDQSLFDLAAEQDRIIITADTDFGELLARRNSSKPSVILLRDDAPAAAASILALLDANLPQLAEALATGSLIVVRATRFRIRPLPLY